MLRASSRCFFRAASQHRNAQLNYLFSSPLAHQARFQSNSNKSQSPLKKPSNIISPSRPSVDKSTKPISAEGAATQSTTTPNSTIVSKKPKSNLTAPAARRVVKSSLPSTTERHGKAIAFATAAGYDLDLLRHKLEQLGYPVRTLMEEAVLYIPQYPLGQANGGEIFVFENGSYVTWGISEPLAKKFLNEIIRDNDFTLASSSSIEQDTYQEMQSEFLHYHVQQESSTRVSSDIIFIGSSDSSSHQPSEQTTTSAQQPLDPTSTSSSPPPLPTSVIDLNVRLSLSYGFTRSTKLAVYEESMVSFLEAAEEIPEQLMAGSEAPVRKSIIIRRLGELLKWRQHLNLVEPNLLDSPEFLWTNASLESYYVSMCRALEVDTRLRTLNKKIDIAREELSMLMDLLSNKTSHRLEWIIIFLIFAEIVLALLREGHPFSKSQDKAERSSNNSITSTT